MSTVRVRCRRFAERSTPGFAVKPRDTAGVRERVRTSASHRPGHRRSTAEHSEARPPERKIRFGRGRPTAPVEYFILNCRIGVGRVEHERGRLRESDRIVRCQPSDAAGRGQGAICLGQFEAEVGGEDPRRQTNPTSEVATSTPRRCGVSLAGVWREPGYDIGRLTCAEQQCDHTQREMTARLQRPRHRDRHTSPRKWTSASATGEDHEQHEQCRSDHADSHEQLDPMLCESNQARRGRRRRHRRSLPA